MPDFKKEIKFIFLNDVDGTYIIDNSINDGLTDGLNQVIAENSDLSLEEYLFTSMSMNTAIEELSSVSNFSRKKLIDKVKEKRKAAGLDEASFKAVITLQDPVYDIDYTKPIGSYYQENYVPFENNITRDLVMVSNRPMDKKLQIMEQNKVTEKGEQFAQIGLQTYVEITDKPLSNLSYFQLFKAFLEQKIIQYSNEELEDKELLKDIKQLKNKIEGKLKNKDYSSTRITKSFNNIKERVVKEENISAEITQNKHWWNPLEHLEKNQMLLYTVKKLRQQYPNEHLCFILTDDKDDVINHGIAYHEKNSDENQDLNNTSLMTVSTYANNPYNQWYYAAELQHGITSGLHKKLEIFKKHESYITKDGERYTKKIIDSLKKEIRFRIKNIDEIFNLYIIESSITFNISRLLSKLNDVKDLSELNKNAQKIEKYVEFLCKHGNKCSDLGVIDELDNLVKEFEAAVNGINQSSKSNTENEFNFKNNFVVEIYRSIISSALIQIERNLKNSEFNKQDDYTKLIASIIKEVKEKNDSLYDQTQDAADLYKIISAVKNIQFASHYDLEETREKISKTLTDASKGKHKDLANKVIALYRIKSIDLLSKKHSEQFNNINKKFNSFYSKLEMTLNNYNAVYQNNNPQEEEIDEKEAEFIVLAERRRLVKQEKEKQHPSMKEQKDHEGLNSSSSDIKILGAVKERRRKALEKKKQEFDEKRKTEIEKIKELNVECIEIHNKKIEEIKNEVKSCNDLADKSRKNTEKDLGKDEKMHVTREHFFIVHQNLQLQQIERKYQQLLKQAEAICGKENSKEEENQQDKIETVEFKIFVKALEKYVGALQEQIKFCQNQEQKILLELEKYQLLFFALDVAKQFYQDSGVSIKEFAEKIDELGCLELKEIHEEESSSKKEKITEKENINKKESFFHDQVYSKLQTEIIRLSAAHRELKSKFNIHQQLQALRRLMPGDGRNTNLYNLNQDFANKIELKISQDSKVNQLGFFERKWLGNRAYLADYLNKDNLLAKQKNTATMKNAAELSQIKIKDLEARIKEIFGTDNVDKWQRIGMQKMLLNEYQQFFQFQRNLLADAEYNYYSSKIGENTQWCDYYTETKTLYSSQVAHLEILQGIIGNDQPKAAIKAVITAADEIYKSSGENAASPDIDVALKLSYILDLTAKISLEQDEKKRTALIAVYELEIKQLQYQPSLWKKLAGAMIGFLGVAVIAVASIALILGINALTGGMVDMDPILQQIIAGIAITAGAGFSAAGAELLKRGFRETEFNGFHQSADHKGKITKLSTAMENVVDRSKSKNLVSF